MKTIKVLILLFLSVSILSCSGDDSDGNNNVNVNLVSPSNPDQLASVLVIPNAEVVASPDLPASSAPAVAPQVSQIDTNISYAAGTQMYIPCNVASPTQNNIAGVYIQVEGASTYFDVPINAGTSNGVISVPVDLPSLVGPGTFTLILKFYDTAGNIGLITEVTITVTAKSNCGTTKVSGGEGLSSNIFVIPAGEEGQIKISYDTYTVPDKIDIYQNGVWIAGTGPSTPRATLRRALNCNVATEAAGYKGEEGEFVFEYNAGAGSEIEVVVSGCEDGGTAWEYEFSCPEVPVPGAATIIVQGSTYTSDCHLTTSSTHTQCGSAGVVAMLTDDWDVHVRINNMPEDSSGIFNIVPYTLEDQCSLSITGSVPDITVGFDYGTGTLTKTGPMSFTFTYTYTNLFTDETRTITGSGTYAPL